MRELINLMSPARYLFWLLAISLLCFLLERAFPWRRTQRAFRPQFVQDLFWLIFNGHFAGLAVGLAGARVLEAIASAARAAGYDLPAIRPVLSDMSPAAQFACVLVAKDFLEYCIHNLLHRVTFLWEFHKLHHSIVELDWIGNFRFHWMEIVVYRGLTYIPLAVLGAEPRVLLWLAILSTLIGHLNHSNLRIDWGPFRRILNSPRFHVWHHDVILRGGHGRNFAIIFAFWDWIFGTAEWPEQEQPERLGFEGMERFPGGLPGRLVYPLRLRPVVKTG